jgi:hypothetical protein
MQSLRDTKTLAAIIDALTHVHGESIARLMLIQGVTLADLIDSLLRSPIKNCEAIKLITQALGSGDFLIAPEIVGARAGIPSLHAFLVTMAIVCLSCETRTYEGLLCHIRAHIPNLVLQD